MPITDRRYANRSGSRSAPDRNDHVTAESAMADHHDDVTCAPPSGSIAGTRGGAFRRRGTGTDPALPEQVRCIDRRRRALRNRQGTAIGHPLRFLEESCGALPTVVTSPVPRSAGSAPSDEENAMSHSPAALLPTRTRPNKVPDPTASFWIIKVLATTVGETAADLLSDTVGLGLPLTTVVMADRARRVPGAAVPCTRLPATALLDHRGADQHRRHLHHRRPHRRPRRAAVLSTTVFAVALASSFLVWFRTRGDPLDPQHRHASAGNRSTGWPSCSPSRSAPPPATWSRNRPVSGTFPSLLLFAVGDRV